MKKIISCLLICTLAFVCLSFISCNTDPYANLKIVDLGQEREYFGIAFRTGSDLTRKVEDITLELIKEGKLEELGAKYQIAAFKESEYTPKANAFSDSNDFAKVKKEGKLVIGITDYKPMDYQGDNGEWIGFDADYARLVCEKLGVKAEFKEIDWDNKELELTGGTIDCIWNGMTITDAVEEIGDCTVPYMYNTQVAVIHKKNAEKYIDFASLEGATTTAESGSAGAKLAESSDGLKNNFHGVAAQTDAILEVISGTSDAAIVDYTLAAALVK